MASSDWPHKGRRCCVCGSEAHASHCEISDPARLTGVIQERQQHVSQLEQIVRCRECGLVYVHPRFEWPSGSRAYPLAHDLAYFERTRAERAIGNVHLLSLVERQLGRKGVWLDVGAGDGLLARQAHAAGWRVTGVEIDAELVAALGVASGAPEIHLGPLEEAGYASASVDVISLINVLEHVAEPDAMVALCLDLLRLGGLLAVHVPNVSSLGARLHGARWRHFEPLSHLTYFDWRTLSRLLRRCGLEPATRFSLPGNNRFKRGLLALLDWMGLHCHDGLGILARKTHG